MEKWMNNKELLTKIFFSDKDTLQRETKDLEDFWSFLDKYERFKSKNKPQEPSILTQFDLDLPLRYDKKYKINFGYSSSVLQAKFQAHRLDHKDSKLTFDEIVEFQKVIMYYLDFLQKKNFAKLLKLKKEQNNLPIKQYEEQIVDAVTTNQVVIVAGDTGCGKSTQVPQYLLNASVSNIACTQPRRLACISLAKRVGYETLNEYKSDIAYQVRFESSRTKRTKVVFLTEGLILRQLQTDPVLSMYDVIVVDEVHERHVNGDFLLGILKCLLTQRTDLKLILMSATINIDLFASYFHGAPVIQVPGRLYPIDLQYMPHFVKKAAIVEKADRLDPSPYLKIMQLIDDKYPSSERGDLLIFMSGMTEIQAVVDAAKEYALKHSKWIILPLHSSLSIQEQDKIFDVAPEGVRKCIVSTNIAETSITIDGVRFIADSGKVKEMSYDPQVKMQRLQEFWISQASAEQRKGRAGRTGPGVCYRLYSDEDYHEFSNYSTPEIHRVPLDTLVLQMASLGLHDATKFPFIEPPPKASLVNSMHFLKQQAALTPEGELTSLGRMLSRLPVDIVIGKMLIMGSLFSLVEPILVIATALSVQSPLTKRFNADPDCDTRRKELFSPHGDPFTLLNLYDEWILTKSDRSTNSRKWCKRRGVEEQRLYEMTKLKRQFEDLLRDHNLLRATRDTGSRGSEKERLLRLKREHRGQSSRKRKMLKMDEVEVSSDEDDDQLDINDIEFKLRHNLKKLEKTSNRRFTYHDINILKLIIASGLYPQLAAPDESNPFRKESEQTFHCKDKQFLMLHPTSVYALQPSFLEDFYFDKSCAQEARYVQSRELLLYVSLLETNKAYVVNTSRIPALQTLLLLSSKIETNADCSLVVFDQWLEMSFEKTFDGSGLLSKVVQIRKAWDTLLEQKLEIYELEDEKEIASKQRKLASLEKMVALKLAEFVDADIAYKLRRLSSADVKHLYNDTEGDLVTPYMRHGCIADTSDVYGEYLQEHYTCENCGLHMVCTVSERLAHHQKCSTEPPEQESEEESGEEEQCGIPKRHFECERCKQTFQFTTVEILKHKQSHAVD